jgi:predicted phage replisome organizer
MAKYDKTKFYWLQIKADFYDDDAISWLEEQENGQLYTNFYLKLCLKSLKTDGLLIREVGNMLIPYDAKKLSEITRVGVDSVVVAMELLQKIGLVEVLENGTLYLTEVQNMIGSQSKSSFKKQQQRALKTGGVDNCPPSVYRVSPKCPPKIEIEKEIELDIEIEKEKEYTPTPKPAKQKHPIYKHVLLTDDEYKRLQADFSDIEDRIQNLDDYIETKKAKYYNHNLVIRKWAKSDNQAKPKGKQTTSQKSDDVLRRMFDANK